MFEICFGIIYK